MKRLTIRATIILVTGGLLCTLIFLLVSQFDRGMKELLVQREQDNIKQQSQVASAILRSSMRTLPDITRDWSKWDAAYNFVAGKNPQFIVEDLNDDLLLLHKLNFIFVFDKNGNVKHQRFFDFHLAKEMEPDADFYLMLEDFKNRVLHRFDGVKEMDLKNPASSGVSGFVVSNNTWFYISAFPTLRSDGRGEANGILLFGRIIDDREIARIQDGIDTIQIHRLSHTKGNDFFAQGRFQSEPFFIDYEKKDTITVYHTIDSVYGDKLILFLEKPRMLYNQGLRVIRILNISIFAVAVIVLALLFFLLEKLLLAPLNDLAKRVENIDDITVFHDVPTSWGYELSVLVSALKKTLEKIAFAQEVIEDQNRDLVYTINHDHLTGLPNALMCKGVIEERLLNARKKNSVLIFLYIRIKNLRLINETLGHSAGNFLLVLLAERLKKYCPESEKSAISCVDGHRFAVIYEEDFVAVEEIKIKAEGIREVLEESGAFEDCQVHASVAIGIATYPADAHDPDELHKKAGIAANAVGMHALLNYMFYDESLLEAITDRLNIEEAISRGIEQDEFAPFFQPKLDLNTGKIVGVEALVRWFSPSGIVMPSFFIPIADETGLIIQITWIMMEKACVENQRFAREGFDISVSVNVPMQVILHTNFVEKTLDILKKTGMPAKKLDIEITEETMIADLEKTSKIMSELQTYGIEISVDDFGTGYSSLQYLQKMPFNTIKIDKLFVDGIPDDSYCKAVIKASVGIAGALMLKVIVEGVETKVQWQAVKEMGCDELQGYVVSKPVSSDDFVALLHKWND